MFLRCVAEAVVEVGLRGLAEEVPGGKYAYDLAAKVRGKMRQQHKEAELRAEVQRLAAAGADEAKRVAAAVARQVARSADEAIDLELYLTAVPGAVRRSLQRADDPAGKSVPRGWGLESADDVLELLPVRPPRFRPGDPLPGQAGWALVEPLGVGGFGEVWLAHHQSGQIGAVKFFHDVAADALRRELDLVTRVMQGVDHPAVVPVLFDKLDAVPPWVMFEYVAGGDLADLVRGWQGLPPADRVGRVLSTLRHLAKAVAPLHQAGVVHRDLKPANVLFDRAAKRLRVTDFGIGGTVAAAAIGRDKRGNTSRGARQVSYLRGAHTPLYASRQQQDGAPPDPRDDVHALGVIGFQLLTGRFDVGVDSRYQRQLAALGVPDAVIELIGDCASGEAEHRPADAGAVAARLAGVYVAAEPGPGRPGPAPAPPPSASRAPEPAAPTSGPAATTKRPVVATALATVRRPGRRRKRDGPPWVTILAYVAAIVLPSVAAAVLLGIVPPCVAILAFVVVIVFGAPVAAVWLLIVL